MGATSPTGRWGAVERPAFGRGRSPSRYRLGMASRNDIAKFGWVGAAVLLAAGVIMIAIGLFTPMGTAAFGWFAYQPLANATFTPGGSAVVLSPITVAGWVILAVGLIMLAFFAGRVAGRRSHE